MLWRSVKFLWGTKGTHIIKPKLRESGIMISDSVDEYNGYVVLTKQEYDHKVTDPSIRMQAREFLEFGEAKVGYWTSDKFLVQIKTAVKIAEVKEKGWHHVWIFDHSSCMA